MTSSAILERLDPFAMRLDLGPSARLLERLGRPDRDYRCVLVAGTNGKGSTAAFLAAMGTAAGARTGLYTSPDLEEPRERIRIDGVALADEELAAGLEEILATAGEERPTHFEALTAAALVAFRRRQVELAVLEVGMGGRLDATNAVDPVVSIVTGIGLEHREHLGPTLAAIAREKAGIFRAGVPTLTWVEEPEAAAALAARALEVGARLVPMYATTEPRELPSEEGRTTWEIRSPSGNLRLSTRVRGGRQGSNLALAAAAARALRDGGHFALEDEAIVAGAAACRWPGRSERVVLPEGREILLDGAHNPQAVAALAGDLGERPFTLVFGALATKQVEEMLPPLAARAARAIVTGFDHPRAVSSSDLALLAPGAGSASGVAEALDRALTGPQGLVVVTGSLHLVGAARTALRRRFGVPAPAAEISSYAPGPAGG